MALLSKLAVAATALLPSSLVFAKSGAYQAGYDIGREVGQVVGAFLPYALAVLLVGGVWVGWRIWARRRRANVRQA